MSSFLILSSFHPACRPFSEILVDFVGRYENLTEDFHKVCQKVGLPKLDLIHYGRTKHPPYQELYTNKMKEIVYAHSSLDIERFGYSK